MNKDLFSKENLVLGHPATLFVLFFTEMWERFSFYGMRVLLVNFLTMALIGYNPGWEWSTENATALFGTYAMLLYLTPIVGGILADRYLGYRWAVVIGSLIMTLGHASMAFETELSLYLGLAMLIIGTGFFKPNMTSIVSEMYQHLPEKKDGAYTIFYMGVNAGAFFGMMLCGYLAERIGWSWGFGLAGIFMLLGTLQFWWAKPLFGEIGAKPTKESGEHVEKEKFSNPEEEKRNPFTKIDYVLIAISLIIGLGYAINDPLSKIAKIDMFGWLHIGNWEGQYIAIFFGLIVFLVLIISRISRYSRVVRDRMIAFIIFAFFTVFFWMSFEQGATSLVIFARDHVNRTLSGNAAMTFNVVNTLLTVVPLGIVTYVLFLLAKKTWKRVVLSNVVLAVCFIGVWAVVLWMLNRDWNSTAYEIAYNEVQTSISPNSYKADSSVLKIFEDKIAGGDAFSYKVSQDETVDIKIDSIYLTTQIVNPEYVSGVSPQSDSLIDKTTLIKKQKSKLEDKKLKKAEQKKMNAAFLASVLAIQNTQNATVLYEVAKDSFAVAKLSDLYFTTPVTENRKLTNAHKTVKATKILAEPISLAVGQDVFMITKDNEGSAYGYLNDDDLEIARERGKALERDNGIVRGKVATIKSNEVEITTSWFSILNSFFIIAFASLFSRWWESKYNPSATGKYALGLIIMAVGFALLAWGAYGVESSGVKVSMIWLILAYLFHTLGELCLSPVGLSYVSKLVPARMIAFMFGMWYLAIAIGNKLAAILGGQIENIKDEYSLSAFFLIFTVVPALAGILILLLHPILKKLMHGVK